MRTQKPGLEASAGMVTGLSVSPSVRVIANLDSAHTSHTTSIAVPTRFIEIDAFRIYAFCAVVFLHAHGPLPPYPSAIGVLDHACRFAVPFFFLTSGYLAPSSGGIVATFVRLFERLFLPFIAWLTIYVIADYFSNPTKYTSAMSTQNIMRIIYTGGPAYHLWFLPALGMSMLLLQATRRQGTTCLLALSVFSFAVAIIFGPYSEFIGLPHFGTRNGPFFGYLFVAIGFLMRQSGPRPPAKFALWLAVTGFLAQLMEALFIWHSAAGPFVPYDFLVATPIFSVGVFFLMFRLSTLSIAARFGPLAFGMYCIHVIYLWLLTPLLGELGWASIPLICLATVILSGASAEVLSRIPLIRRLVV